MSVYHYKSWSGLNKELQDRLCDSLKGRITYFLTRYHDVHNAYGRASIRLDGKELVEFDWVDMYKQESDIHDLYRQTGDWSNSHPELLSKWNREGTFSDYDFLSSATSFLQLNITDSLKSDNFLVRVFAILDNRVGKRTLMKIKENEEYLRYPSWVKQFYELRLNEISI